MNQAAVPRLRQAGRHRHRRNPLDRRPARPAGSRPSRAERPTRSARSLIGRPTIEKATVQARSKHVVVFPYSTYLPDLFGNATVTTATIAAKQPAIWSSASAPRCSKGLKYTIQHPDEAGKLLHAKHPETDAAAATQEIKLMTPAVTAEGTANIGVITEARMQGALTGLEKAGVIQPGMTPQDVVDFAAMKSS
ncbi:hypothetical protein ACRAWF_15620 [Streptomyces sp. L7]